MRIVAGTNLGERDAEICAGVASAANIPLVIAFHSIMTALHTTLVVSV